jgi:hypothetical protein
MLATNAGSPSSARKRNGGLIGLAGAVLLVAGSFLTWLESFGRSFSGWGLYDGQNDIDEFPFMIDKMFSTTFDPFFTGGATVALGLLLGGLAVAVLVAPERPLGVGRTRVHPALYGFVVLAVIGAFMVAFANLWSYFGRPDEVDVSLAPGFWVPIVGIALAAYGLTSAAGRTRKELAAPAAPTRVTPPVGPAPNATAAGWYPDPAQRHQVRYWDGASWTSHVADAGAQSEDPVPTG